MKSLLTSRYVLGSTLIVILIIAFVGGYYGLLLPQEQHLAQMNDQLKSEQKLLAILQKKQVENHAVLHESTKKLQLELPVKPLEDQFLLDLHKAELNSGSHIQTIGISEGNTELSIEERLKKESTFQYGENNSSSKEISSAKSANHVTTAVTPNLIQTKTFNLVVESPDYEQLSAFLQELEGLQRITTIDSLSFTGNQETALIEQGKPLTYNLSVTTYYVPQLTDLMKDVPVVEYPKPANKENPLYSGRISE